ncbi:iron ABC transporter substrate-binding protein [Bacillus manliponensis]|uniref:iron ABC transporter substrate-binding protein n=1 Tax=Bacillus manliponensis TaxID=574376 RepID=UPI00351254A1
MDIINMLFCLFGLFAVSSTLWKMYKTSRLKKSVGQLVATYSRKKSRLWTLIGIPIFSGLMAYKWVQYHNGEIATLQSFLLEVVWYSLLLLIVFLTTWNNMKPVEVYETGIVDGMHYYPYDEIKGYKTSTIEYEKENIYLDRGFEKNNYIVKLSIQKEHQRRAEEVLSRYIPKLIAK